MANNTDMSDASYKKVGKGISGIPTSVTDSGQRKAKTESGYPGMQDSTPQESDKRQSAP